MDEDGLKQTQTGQTNWFGGHIQSIVDCAKKGHVARFFANLGRD